LCSKRARFRSSARPAPPDNYCRRAAPAGSGEAPPGRRAQTEMADAGGRSRRAQMLVYGRERKAKEMTTREMVMDTLKVSTVLGGRCCCAGPSATTDLPAARARILSPTSTPQRGIPRRTYRSNSRRWAEPFRRERLRPPVKLEYHAEPGWIRIYVQLDKPVPLCNPSGHLRAIGARTVEKGLQNGAQEGLGADAQDLAPARSPYSPASIHGSRTLRPTTN